MTMQHSIAITTLFCAALAACAQFPELDGTVPADTKTTPYPKLISLQDALEAQTADRTRAQESQQSVTDRLAALRARAAQMQGQVIDSPTRTRMERGIDRF